MRVSPMLSSVNSCPSYFRSDYGQRESSKVCIPLTVPPQVITPDRSGLERNALRWLSMVLEEDVITERRPCDLQKRGFLVRPRRKSAIHLRPVPRNTNLQYKRRTAVHSTVHGCAHPPSRPEPEICRFALNYHRGQFDIPPPVRKFPRVMTNAGVISKK